MITFNKTAVGWYNYTIAGLMRYNVDPETFREITGVSKDAALGTVRLTDEQLDALQAKSTYIGLAEGWEWVPSDEQIS